MLNGRPYMLRLVLDQGYWPDTLLAAPSDEALRRDVELAKAMGFNGVRKHQKIEDPRYLYWADRLGLLVWEEMPSAYRFTRTAIKRTVREWTEAIERDYSHPCIIVWVPFNESWGVPELPTVSEQRHAVQALYHLTKTLDPTRPVIGNDGWESGATDIIGIHDYDANTEHMRAALRRRGPARAAVRPAPAGRPRPDARRLSAPRPADHADRVRRHRLREARRQPGVKHDLGLLERRDRGGVRATLYEQLLDDGDPHARCSAASATRSSPTPSRRRTACSAPTARRRFRSSGSRAATRVSRTLHSRERSDARARAAPSPTAGG